MKKIKRSLDIIIGIIGVVCLVPLTIGIVISKIILKEKGPIFYCQYRIGQNGKLFKLYKYRSMVEDAEEKLEKYLEEDEELKKEYMQYRKLTEDPRVTKIGKFIRKTNIDEFPQFINVLKGDMSIVGPRPYLEIEKPEMKQNYNDIISCKPGLTGPWQTSNYEEKDFYNRLKLDVKYIKENNLKTDLIIIFRTIKQICKHLKKYIFIKNT